MTNDLLKTLIPPPVHPSGCYSKRCSELQSSGVQNHQRVGVWINSVCELSFTAGATETITLLYSQHLSQFSNWRGDYSYIKQTHLKYHPSCAQRSSSWAKDRVSTCLPTESALSHRFVFVCLVFWATWTHAGMLTSFCSARCLHTYKIYEVIHLMQMLTH